MNIPKWLRLAGLMCLNYGLNAVSFRFVAKGSYLGVAVADAAIASVGFTLLRSVASAETWQERAGYIVGGVVGSMLGIWLTP